MMFRHARIGVAGLVQGGMNHAYAAAIASCLALGLGPLPGRAPSTADRTARQALQASDRLSEPNERRANEVQPPGVVMDLLGIRPGQVIGEVGSGRGRVTVHLADRVGDKGRVYANDIDTAALDLLKQRCSRLGFANVEIVAGLPDDARLPADRLDLVLMTWVYHHVDERVALLKSLVPSLKPWGVIAMVEPTPETTESGRAPLTRESVDADARAAGLRLDAVIEGRFKQDNVFVLRPVVRLRHAHSVTPLAGGSLAGGTGPVAPSEDARAVECGLVAPDVKAPLRIFSPEYYQAQKPACLADRMAFYKVPGVTIAVIDGHAVAWSKAYGVLEAGTDRPVTPESVFEAASATKMLTTVIALRLAERGVLDLDRDVNAYLKSWRIPSGPLTAATPVTLRLLLTHRAGINRPDKGLPYDEQRPPTLPQVLAGAPPAINQGVVVERAPGSSHQYSNIGFLAVQLVLEEATGKKYEQLASELVFKPLGLDASTVSHPLTPAWRSRWGVPHDEKAVAHARSLMPDAVAHAGLVTTPSDLARLALEIGLASEGRSTRLLSKRSAQMMLTTAADFDPGLGVPLGQGLGVMLLGAGRTLHFLHPGANHPGANCWIIVSAASGRGAAIMTNAAAGEALMLEILASIGHHYHWPDMSAGK